ncbi:MAG: aminotransferase class I/II-fold pyridoxal phosphate-dependent enzyme [Patescibacteria group bacterium]
MKRPIAISLSPNTEADDVGRARSALRRPEIQTDGEWPLAVERKLEEIFPGHKVALTSSGRQALLRLFKALNIGSGDEVLLQAFTCSAVPASIMWAGARPVYADITPGTYNLDPEDVRRKIKPTTKAIIVQHTFGIPGPIAELREIASRHNLVLIEDCAHCLGQKYQGQPLGTFGDAAILSFGRDKILSSVFGGAVVSKNEELIRHIQDQQRALPFPPRRWVRQQLLHPILFDVILPTYFMASLGKVALVALQRLGFLSKALAPEEKRVEKPEHLAWCLSPALAYLLLHQLDKLDRYTVRRREIVSRYAERLGGSRESLLRFPLEHPHARHIRQVARRSRMLLGDWYDTPVAPADVEATRFGYVPGSCPAAEAASKNILNLPAYPTLTNDQVDQVIQFIQDYDASYEH